MDEFESELEYTSVDVINKVLSPYSKHSIRTLFGRVLIWTNDRNNSETPARKSYQIGLSGFLATES